MRQKKEKKYYERKCKAKMVSKTNYNNSFLDKHNTISYIEDLEIMGKLFNMSKSKREWIEVTRYQLS